MAFRLEGAAQLGRPVAGTAGDDDRVHGRVSQHLFQVADPLKLQAPAAQVFGADSGTG